MIVDSTLPLISVGIPTFNRPECLRRTLESIINQTYHNLEIIISDNASPSDDVHTVVQEYLSRDSRIKYFKQSENIGPTLNFQFVLDNSVGEYFIWVSDDDWRSVEFIEVLYQELSSDKYASVAFCKFDVRDEQGSKIENYPDHSKLLRKMTLSNQFVRQISFFLLREGAVKPLPIYGLYRKEIFKNFSLPNFVDIYGPSVVDALFVFWVMCKGRLALSEKNLIGFTPESEKQYETTNNKRHIITKIKSIFSQIKYIFKYTLISNGIARYIIMLLIPYKIVSFLLMRIYYLFSKYMRNS